MVHETQQCPVCAEEIRAKALRCQFCGEVLAPRRYKEARRKLDKAQPQRATRPRRGRTLLRSPLSWIMLAGIVVVAVVLIVWLRGLSETPAKLMGLWQGMSCAQVAERLHDSHIQHNLLVRKHYLPLWPEYVTRDTLARTCSLASESLGMRIGVTDPSRSLLLVTISTRDDKVVSWKADVEIWTSSVARTGATSQHAIIAKKMVAGANILHELHVESERIGTKITDSLGSPLAAYRCPNFKDRMVRFWRQGEQIAWTGCETNAVFALHSVRHVIEHYLSRSYLVGLRNKFETVCRKQGLGI